MKRITPLIVALFLTCGDGFSQSSLGTQLAELVKLKEKVANLDTRTRVYATHRVWTIGLESVYSEVKLSALDLLGEPVRSVSDHIRMPAVYAIVEIANSTNEVQVKIKALGLLREPMKADQVPIRDVAIDAVNLITRSGNRSEIAVAALTELGPAVKSVNNGVRIPAINAIVRAVEDTHNESAYGTAIDLLVAPLDSSATIGGMEVRMMAVAAVEKIGIEASDVRTKGKALGLLQSYAAKGSWEPEAKKRAGEAAASIQASMK
jgi:hypothetical protein